MEVLNDSFEIGRVHMFFATYDVNKPKGKRQTNSVAIYLPISEVIELYLNFTLSIDKVVIVLFLISYN